MYDESGRIVLVEMVALEPQHVSNQQFAVLRGDSDETAVEAIGVGRIDDRVDPQHFDKRFEEGLIRKQQSTGENVVGLEECVDRQADAARAQIDWFFDELTFGGLRLRLKTDGKRDGDAIVLAALSP